MIDFVGKPESYLDRYTMKSKLLLYSPQNGTVSRGE